MPEAMTYFAQQLPRLTGPRVMLREMRMKDYRDLYAFSSDERVSRYMFWRTHERPEDSIHYLAVTKQCQEDGDIRNWGIVHLENGKLIGTIGYTELIARHNSAEIGYCLHPDYWGQGLATEALGLVLAYSFDVLELNRVEAQHHIENAASGRVMARCGMHYEGCLRQRVYAKGSYWDMCVYAMLMEDYERGKSGQLDEGSL